ncbi:hypothetical protein VPH35_078095 [Triticum aestivum]|uniref:Uncharacterized protein n=1 Tax=Aegilops tauschii subsp. strangulata TaxID=200361 RepID=A0A453I3R3_AEGTS
MDGLSASSCTSCGRRRPPAEATFRWTAVRAAYGARPSPRRERGCRARPSLCHLGMPPHRVPGETRPREVCAAWSSGQPLPHRQPCCSLARLVSLLTLPCSPAADVKNPPPPDIPRRRSALI